MKLHFYQVIRPVLMVYKGKNMLTKIYDLFHNSLKQFAKTKKELPIFLNDPNVGRYLAISTI